ncbi:unnamed protein product [Peronospora belbahrii]|uniref:t-SNARE coiled-coil homology domain-containing protein n=1 Tax=Peronospora belbahrii TaxID=622444 RepID=A0ABN8CS79_9STRA|nr:unnamed protein product [Peronospora belbahrii]
MEKKVAMAVASGDPFYVFKDELVAQVSDVNQKLAKWRTLLDINDSKEIVALTYEIEEAVAIAVKSVRFLDETIVMVKANRARFEHIDTTEITSRKAFVASIRKELQDISIEISSNIVKAHILQQEDKSILPTESADSHRPHVTERERNDRFLKEETQRQHQTIQEQDTSLAELQTNITNLHKVTVEISDEVKQQNKMLDGLTDDVEEAQERMNFVMKRLSKLLKTKDKCQLGLILMLVAVLVVMIFLVVYT